MPEGCVVSGVPPEAAPGVGAVGYKTNWHDICLKNTPENKLAWSMPKKYARKTLSYIYIYTWYMYIYLPDCFCVPVH